MSVENARSYQVAQNANRLKDEFLATLSHELRTPLNAVLGYARMFRSGAVPADRMPHAFEVMERNAGALAQIVEDVLDVSRIISGKARIEMQPTDISKVLDDGVATLAPSAEARGITIERSLDAAGFISGDPNRLRQVFWNLLSNAVKFTPEGGRVSVALRRLERHVEVEVRDTGIGFTPEFRPLSFRAIPPGRERTDAAPWRARSWAVHRAPYRRDARRDDRGEQRRAGQGVDVRRPVAGECGSCGLLGAARNA